MKSKVLQTLALIVVWPFVAGVALAALFVEVSKTLGAAVLRVWEKP